MIIPKVLESRTEYAGKIVSIRRDKLTRGDGNTFIRETAVASDAVGIVAMDDRGRILLIRQYRRETGGDCSAGAQRGDRHRSVLGSAVDTVSELCRLDDREDLCLSGKRFEGCA